MVNDPRKFVVKQCGNVAAKATSEDAKRKDFFASLGNVGAITGISGTPVGKGLNSLAQTSQAIRQGDSVPESRIPNDGTDVLIETGISEASQIDAGGFNPRALNTALDTAGGIANKVKAGEFDISDIPGVFSDIQNLSSVVDGIFPESPSKQERIEVCQASPYAMDLMSYAPKFKFLFVMEIEFTEPYAEAMNRRQMAYVIKSSTRPNISFEHEEVNMYNFWVKIPKRTVYEPMTMRFYDDNQNWAMRLYTAYLKAVSPIANLSWPENMESKPQSFESQSMVFDRLSPAGVSGGTDRFNTSAYSASMGVLAGSDVKNVIRRITMYHIFQYGKKMNTYRFFNPKITSMELDDVDMADSGNGNEIIMQFAYDSVSIALGVDLKSSDRKGQIEDLTGNGLWPLMKADAPADEGDEDSDGQEPEDPDEGGGFFEGAGEIAGTITGGISGAIDAATGLVSDAFTSVSNFAGSAFSDFTAGASSAAASAKNAVSGSDEPGK